MLFSACFDLLAGTDVTGMASGWNVGAANPVWVTSGTGWSGLVSNATGACLLFDDVFMFGYDARVISTEQDETQRAQHEPSRSITVNSCRLLSSSCNGTRDELDANTYLYVLRTTHWHRWNSLFQSPLFYVDRLFSWKELGVWMTSIVRSQWSTRDTIRRSTNEIIVT
jgi:hypothetical protein